jgi:NAD(P)-dependent dehydrogenase (short-subunit alcohol dehydrogenase family)
MAGSTGWGGAPAERRTAVVSGASAGIGRAIAEAFGAEGWRVALGARRPDRLEAAAQAVKAAGGEAFAHRLDVTDADSVETFFEAAEAALGPVDLLVNNAAIGKPGPLHEMSPAQIRAEVETGLLGALFLSRCAIASMTRGGRRGDLVFISSTSAAVPWPRHVPYSASKGGLETAAHALSLELEGTGIRSLVLRVGNTAGTEFSASWGPAEFATVSEPWTRLGLLRHAGLMTPELVARAVLVAVTAPRGLQLDRISLNPEAPLGPPGSPETGRR